MTIRPTSIYVRVMNNNRMRVGDVRFWAYLEVAYATGRREVFPVMDTKTKRCKTFTTTEAAREAAQKLALHKTLFIIEHE